MTTFQVCRVWMFSVLFLTIGNSQAVVIDGRIDYLNSAPAKMAVTFAGSIRFQESPTDTQLQQMAALGVEFDLYHSRTVYPARIPFACLPALRLRTDLVSVESAWRPVSVPPLMRSAEQVEANLVWQMKHDGGSTVTGKGVLVADMDSGVNYLHPAFLEMTDERYQWLDVDHTGDFTRRDAVDLNHNGIADPGESLRHREALGTATYGNELGPYNAGFDFLYNDANNDDMRNYGPPQFDEFDPCFGERLFMCEDTNGNDCLDVGETLLALGGTRIRAIRNLDGTVYRRGVDLFESEMDDYHHGTQVSGIIAGGWPGWHRMTGMAPGAEIIHANISYGPEPPFLLPAEAGLAWVVAEGADVVLVEDGEWIWEFLDGSSNFEVMITEFTEDDGIIFIAPVGNLGRSQMHCRFASKDDQGLEVTKTTSVIWASFLWTEAVGQDLVVTSPIGRAAMLPLDGSTLVLGDYEVYANLSVSVRGTRRLDLRLGTVAENGAVAGSWGFNFRGENTEIHGYFSDNIGWWSESNWEHGEENTHTVTWPATADSAIGVAAYTTFGDYTISDYSGRGPRIDGAPCLDVAAPGEFVSSANPAHVTGYISFAGTSGAGGHVAGAAALLKELDPNLNHARCRRFLRAGALRDQYSADPRAAGAGRLKIHAAALALLNDLHEAPPRPKAVIVAYPNPFNAHVVIRFRQVVPGGALLRIFDAAGREVWSTQVADDGLEGPDRWREVSWPGVDRQGKVVASGVYFTHVRQGDVVSAGKLALVR